MSHRMRTESRIAPAGRRRARRAARAAGRRSRGRAGQLGGMTLVELLVVITIIVLLVTMLMPAFAQIRMAVYKARSLARISELSSGAAMYAKDNRNLYPGQMYHNMLGTGSGQYTGSQVLAACLFDYGYAGIGNATDPNGTGRYAPYSRTDLINNPGGKTNSIWDKFPRGQPMAILYYPSRAGVTGMDQFKPNDNAAYTGTNYSGWMGGSFNNPNGYIADKRFDANGRTPYMSGGFLLMGAGADGIYGTLDDARSFGS